MKIVLAIFLCLVFVIDSFSQTKTDFSGEWTLDFASSKIADTVMFPALSKTIVQSTDKIEILNDSVIKKVFPDSTVRPFVYPLDGSKANVPSNGRETGQRTLQAKFNSDGTLLLTENYQEVLNRTFGTETLITELWGLIDNEKTLKISGTSKNYFQNYSFELVYRKIGSGSISDLDSRKSVKQQQQTDGIINGKALKLITPPYPPEAKKAGFQGNVFVEVLVDEQGNVVLARTIAGHPTLAAVSEQSALLCKFSPTKIKGVPVSATGIIVYNFKRQ